MREIPFGATGPYLPNSVNSETAASLAQAVFTISNSVAVLYFVAIQYLLMRIQSSKLKTRPTTSETNVGITALWIVHRILDLSLSTIIDEIIRTVWGREIALNYKNIRYGAAVEPGNWVLVPASWTWGSSLTVIFWEVMVTWLIYMTICLSVDMTPNIMEARQRPEKAFARFQRRCFELVDFVGTLFQEGAGANIQSGSTSVRKLVTKSICDDGKDGKSIELRRHHDENPVDGQRTLNWDLKVDQEALREMMETLGPPGMLFAIVLNNILGS